MAAGFEDKLHYCLAALIGFDITIRWIVLQFLGEKHTARLWKRDCNQWDYRVSYEYREVTSDAIHVKSLHSKKNSV